MLKLLNLGYNHSHNNLIGHDDYHGEKSKEARTLSQFHLHSDGAPIEVNSEIIRKCYGFILLFTVGVGMHYVIFVSRKPKPASTLVVQKRETIIFVGLYLLFMLLVLVILIIVFLLAVDSHKFNQKWLDELKEVKEGYQCTFPSLWINLDQLQKELNSDLSNQFVTVI